MGKLEKSELAQRVDKMGQELGLTHYINKNLKSSFHKAERRIKYAGFYNLVNDLIYLWNQFLNKLKIGEI
jgi:hypothetical protein